MQVQEQLGGKCLNCKGLYKNKRALYQHITKTTECKNFRTEDSRNEHRLRAHITSRHKINNNNNGNEKKIIKAKTLKKAREKEWKDSIANRIEIIKKLEKLAEAIEKEEIEGAWKKVKEVLQKINQHINNTLEKKA